LEKIILLDTNILIEILKGNQETISIIEQHDTVFISEVSAMELYYGALDKKELMKLKKFTDIFELLHIDSIISKTASSLIYEYAKSHNLNIPDALIAATAIVHNHTLFTYNKKDFRYIKELSII